MAVRRAAMYCVQCTIVLHLRVTNHTVEIRFVCFIMADFQQMAVKCLF